MSFSRSRQINGCSGRLRGEAQPFSGTAIGRITADCRGLPRIAPPNEASSSPTRRDSIGVRPGTLLSYIPASILAPRSWREPARVQRRIRPFPPFVRPIAVSATARVFLGVRSADLTPDSDPGLRPRTLTPGIPGFNSRQRLPTAPMATRRRGSPSTRTFAQHPHLPSTTPSPRGSCSAPPPALCVPGTFPAPPSHTPTLHRTRGLGPPASPT